MATVGVIGVIVVLAIGWAWLRPKLRSAAHQHVFERRKHADGKDLTNTVTNFVAVADPPAVVGAVEAALTAKRTDEFFAKRYTVKERTDSTLRVSFGTDRKELFVVAVSVRRTDPGRVEGSYQVVRVMTADGIIERITEMRDCRDSTMRAVAALDRSATFSDSYQEGRIL